MLYLENVLKVNPENYDEVWMICRSLKGCEDIMNQYSNIHHVPELAPPEPLFLFYRYLYHENLWDKRWFHECYVPVFITALQKNTQAQKLLADLVSFSHDRNIALACFCEEECLCHRSIIAGILKNMDAVIQCEDQYKKYKLYTDRGS